MQQAPVVQDPLRNDTAPQADAGTGAEIPPAPPVIAAQPADPATATSGESSSQEAPGKPQQQTVLTGTEQPIPTTPLGDATVTGTQPDPGLSKSSGVTADAAPVAAGSVRGVLFRIFPPMPTTLPAELAVAGSGSAVDVRARDAASASTDAVSPQATVSTDSVAASEPALETAQQPSYLLGTIHFGTPDEQGIDYALLEKALAEVDTFVNEANLDEAWKSDYDDYRWLSPTQPLSKMVSNDSYAMARSLLPNVRPQDLVRMKPWSVLALLEARGETAGDTSMDGRLQRIAAAAGKRLVHLETLQQQLQALDCVPATEHALVLDERLRAPWILRDESAAAMGYYRSRNLDAWLADIDHMYGLSYEGKAIEQRSRHCLLEARNARWVGQLETVLQDGPSFVAVGAIHLVGADGLLAALRRDGYRIEEVPL